MMMNNTIMIMSIMMTTMMSLIIVVMVMTETSKSELLIPEEIELEDIGSLIKDFIEYNPSDSYNATNYAEKYGIPALIVAGTQKGGTHAIQEYLGKHSQMLASENKEPHFFDMHCGFCTKSTYLKSNRERYARTFWNISKIEQNPQLMAFEKTPIYMLEPQTMHNIKVVVPWAKILIILRDPIERAYSHFKMNYKTLINRKIRGNLTDFEISFEDCIQSDMSKMNTLGMLNETFLQSSNDVKREKWDRLLRSKRIGGDKSKWCDSMIIRGLYSLQLRPVFDEYGPEAKDKILVIRSEDLRPNLVTNMIDLKPITDFLGIDEMNIIAEKNFHATDAKVSGPMTDQDLNTLRRLYDPYNKELHSILGDGWEDPWP
mmetsp:Transcript_2987/g.3974  ORF Transcript_2987/g.3974 Transcript_2987/m.3974 type:complete len:373 (-) Transcript_2987:399-1517(-)